MLSGVLLDEGVLTELRTAAAGAIAAKFFAPKSKTLAWNDQLPSAIGVIGTGFFCLLLICFWVCIFFWACSQDAANSSHSSLLKFFFCPLFVCHSFLSLLLLLFFISKNYFDFAPCVNSGWIQFRVLVQKNEKKDPSGVGLFFVKTKCNVCVCCLLYVYGFFFN